MTPPSATDLQRQLGKILSAARQRLHLPMRDVSAKCELSETYYGIIERGQRRPSLEVLLSILDLLGIRGAERDRALVLFGQSHIADALHTVKEPARALVLAALWGTAAPHPVGVEPDVIGEPARITKLRAEAPGFVKVEWQPHFDALRKQAEADVEDVRRRGAEAARRLEQQVLRLWQAEQGRRPPRGKR